MRQGRAIDQAEPRRLDSRRPEQLPVSLRLLGSTLTRRGVLNMEKAEIVVTGASGALGSGVVRALTSSGQRVIAVERNAERAQHAFATLPNCRVLGFDLSSPDAWQSALGASEISGAVLVAGAWQGG